MFLKTTDMIYIKIVSNFCYFCNVIRILDFDSVVDEKWSFLCDRFSLFMQKIRPRQANDQGNVIIVH